MKDGRIAERGVYDELLSHKGEFSIFVQEYFTNGNGTMLAKCPVYLVCEIVLQINVATAHRQQPVFQSIISLNPCN